MLGLTLAHGLGGDVLELCAEMTHDLSYTLWAEIETQLKQLSPVLAAGTLLPRHECCGNTLLVSRHTVATSWLLMRVCGLLALVGYKNFAAFEDYVRSLTRSAAAAVGWDPKPDDTHLTKMLRAVLIRLQAEYPTPEAIEEAKTRFSAFVADPDSTALPAEYRAPVYKIMVKVKPAAGQPCCMACNRFQSRSLCDGGVAGGRRGGVQRSVQHL